MYLPSYFRKKLTNTYNTHRRGREEETTEVEAAVFILDFLFLLVVVVGRVVAAITLITGSQNLYSSRSAIFMSQILLGNLLCNNLG